jgi:hypothetical protein
VADRYRARLLIDTTCADKPWVAAAMLSAPTAALRLVAKKKEPLKPQGGTATEAPLALLYIYCVLEFVPYFACHLSYSHQGTTCPTLYILCIGIRALLCLPPFVFALFMCPSPFSVCL